MYGSLIEEQYGVRIVEIQQEVRGSLVPEELAEALEAKAGRSRLAGRPPLSGSQGRAGAVFRQRPSG